MNPTIPFQRVSILGPGLLGGSVAHAIRQHMPQCELRLWARREQPLEYARSKNLADICTNDLPTALRNTDLVILATPIGAFKQLAEQIIPHITENCLVTDLGSVKNYVHRITGEYLAQHNRLFIGSHPMAGAEKQGIEHAYAELLQNATIVLCNEQNVAEKHLKQLDTFWQTLGGKTYTMGAKQHDQTVARISHLPHVLAGLCARGANDPKLPIKDLRRLASSGFRDTTRVCVGSSSMWADILWENDVAIREALTDCVEDLQQLIQLLEQQDKQCTEEWLEKAKLTREHIFDKGWSEE